MTSAQSLHHTCLWRAAVNCILSSRGTETGNTEWPAALLSTNVLSAAEADCMTTATDFPTMRMNSRIRASALDYALSDSAPIPNKLALNRHQPIPWCTDQSKYAAGQPAFFVLEKLPRCPTFTLPVVSDLTRANCAY